MAVALLATILLKEQELTPVLVVPVLEEVEFTPSRMTQTIVISVLDLEEF